MAYEPNWLDVAGLVNIRDFGGMSTADGRTIRAGVAMRSDNLDDLPEPSIDWLLGERQVSDIIDLRTNSERAHAHGFPFDGRVRVHELSLYPEDNPDDPIPTWFGEMSVLEDGDPPDTVHIVAGHYLGYFRTRPENIVQAVRAVAQAPGAAIINCAAGKDRTGTVSAVLLSALGVPEDQVLADYAASTDRIVAILSKLGFGASAGSAEHDADVQSQSTPPELMELVLSRVTRDFGSVSDWLEVNGWMPEDQERLEAKLLG
ncbi:tyrosine-protein phosphatase [Propionimicrobium sp. PCR01-08-3]|uniref:tyrosine-protein phosphatase n=1 Tax=Propionimicrobium sp. PCR01-08-3 TaxID=3052086 RepID=UPI00255D15ED|nr:tyrosine-protein phosphatase [Propionimicrobium sp. PCR01-08-3]WIY83885.1 tyrosine-protein phosphatase [Propionimicrobium sp. PCR01-08-3]